MPCFLDVAKNAQIAQKVVFSSKIHVFFDVFNMCTHFYIKIITSFGEKSNVHQKCQNMLKCELSFDVLEGRENEFCPKDDTLGGGVLMVFGGVFFRIDCFSYWKCIFVKGRT